ncbi:MAG: DUF1648 domain-containing protein [Candidatus Pacebacteria bacterium]|nr:DUF1648 domain-containing protein [Candidatus Paceibacterota bacterium]
MRKSELAAILIILISFVVGIYFYPKMPQEMASHWNSQGKVDGYTSKFWGLFLMPIISAGMFLLFVLIPRIDPLKENIKTFRKYFDWFIFLIFVFLFYLYVLTIVWNSGYKFDLVRFLAPAFGLLFYSAGVLVENAKRNWFIGIRTPWTLSNDVVWDKTHKLGGRLFKISAGISFLGIFFPDFAIYFVIIPVILFSIYLFAYSYLEYKKNNK